MTSDLLKKAVTATAAPEPTVHAVAAGVLEPVTVAEPGPVQPAETTVVMESRFEVDAFLSAVEKQSDPADEQATVDTMESVTQSEPEMADEPVHAGGTRFSAYEVESLYDRFEGLESLIGAAEEDALGGRSGGMTVGDKEMTALLDPTSIDQGFDIPEIVFVPETII